MHLQEFRYKFTFPEHDLIVREEMEMLSFSGIMFLIETKISDGNYTVITILNCTRGNCNILIFRNHISDRNNDLCQ